MQPEPTAVSQPKFFVDSHPAEPLASIQHGHDFCGDDHRVSGSLRRGVAGDRAGVLSGAALDERGSPLNGSTPSSPLVDRGTGYEHENDTASSLSSSQHAGLGFNLVASSRQCTVPFEAFPNGMTSHPFVYYLILYIF